jgi:hypothetical protein
MGQRKGSGWINPYLHAAVCGSPAEFMHHGAIELFRRWKDGGRDYSVAEIIEVIETLEVISEVLGDGMMASYMAKAAKHEIAVSENAGEAVRKVAKDVGRVARDLQRALGHVGSDPGQRKELMRRGF